VTIGLSPEDTVDEGPTPVQGFGYCEAAALVLIIPDSISRVRPLLELIEVHSTIFILLIVYFAMTLWRLDFLGFATTTFAWQQYRRRTW
jgi:hypothetical protein